MSASRFALNSATAMGVSSAIGDTRGLVSRLRRALGPAGNRLVAHEGGYLLRAAPEEIDAERFTRLVAQGGEDLAASAAYRRRMTRTAESTCGAGRNA